MLFRSTGQHETTRARQSRGGPESERVTGRANGGDRCSTTAATGGREPKLHLRTPTQATHIRTAVYKKLRGFRSYDSSLRLRPGTHAFFAGLIATLGALSSEVNL